MRMYSRIGALEAGYGVFIYFPKLWDPVNNPPATGPGVEYIEVKFDRPGGNPSIRARMYANGGALNATAGSKHGYFVNTGIVNNLIEFLFDFDNNTLSIGFNGINVNPNIPIVGSSWNIDSIGGIVFTAPQEVYFSDFKVKTLAR